MAAGKRPTLDLGFLDDTAPTRPAIRCDPGMLDEQAERRREIEMMADKRAKMLGEGMSAIVYEVVCKGERHAVKKASITGTNFDMLRNELEIATLLRDKGDQVGVLKNIDCWMTQTHLLLLMDPANMSLKNCIGRVEIPEDATRLILRQCLHGLNFIHGLNLIHRDIKPANIMLSIRNDARIGDFATAINLQDAQKAPTTQVGTYSYMAPEQHLKPNIPTTMKVDIWAIGMTLVEMLIGGYPQGADEKLTTVHDLQKAYKEKYCPATCLTDTNDDDIYCLKAFAKWCLLHDPKERPTVDILVKQYPETTPESNQQLILNLIFETQSAAHRSSM